MNNIQYTFTSNAIAAKMRLIDEKILVRKVEKERENEKVIPTNEISDDSLKEKGITDDIIKIIDSEEDEVETAKASSKRMINKKILARKMKKERGNEKMALTGETKQNSSRDKSVSDDVPEIIASSDSEDDKNKSVNANRNTPARKVKKESNNEKANLTDKPLNGSSKKKSITGAVIEIVASEEDENKRGKEKEMSNMDDAPRKLNMRHGIYLTSRNIFILIFRILQLHYWDCCCEIYWP